MTIIATETLIKRIGRLKAKRDDLNGKTAYDKRSMENPNITLQHKQRLRGLAQWRRGQMKSLSHRICKLEAEIDRRAAADHD